eukprot:scaffold3431_cov119-Skeletonema_marinoi.AAC.1
MADQYCGLKYTTIGFTISSIGIIYTIDHQQQRDEVGNDSTRLQHTAPQSCNSHSSLCTTN